MKKFRWFLVGLLITGIVLGGIGIAYAGNGIGNGQGIFGKMFGKGFKDGAKIGVTNEKIADFLGIQASDLISARKDGKSLAQIAADNGKTEEALISFIVTEEKAQLDTLLKDGKITQVQYNNMIANLETKVKEMVESTNVRGPLFDKMKDAYRRGFKNGLKMGILDEKIADFLGIQASDLISARKDGKSLAQIAADNGKTEEALISFIVTEEKAQLDTLLKGGKITQVQYNNMIANLETKVKEMVESTNVGKPVPGFGGCRGGN